MPHSVSIERQALADALAGATSWREVQARLGRPAGNNRSIQRLAEQYGLDTSQVDGRLWGRRTSALPEPVIVQGKPNFADFATSHAVAWFSERGATVSIPISPSPYDLVADWGDGLARIQVKSSQTLIADRYRVKLQRTEYVRAADGATGRYIQVPYVDGEVDYFFIVCAGMECYLIPWEAVSGQGNVSLPGLYGRYRV